MIDIFVRNALVRLTSPGSGHEYGVTINDILNESNKCFLYIFPDQQPILIHQVKQVLSNLNDVVNIQMNDGTLLYRIVMNRVMRENYQKKYLPDNKEDLIKEIKEEQKRNDELIKQKKHLVNSINLLQNQQQLNKEIKELSIIVKTLYNMEKAIDENIRNTGQFISNDIQQK